HFRDRLVSLAAEPDQLYQYLKSYLMLSLPEHLDTQQLNFVGNHEWQLLFAADDTTRQRLALHFNALIAEADRMQPAKRDDAVVERARNSLKAASLPVLTYNLLKLEYLNDKDRAIDVGSELGLGADSVFVRKSGKDLSDPVPGMYSKP